MTTVPISAAAAPWGAGMQAPSAAPGDPARTAALRARAEELEAAFLSEMLGHAGVGRAVEGFGGGGAGEEQFASFLRRAQADAIVRAGGIGLAEAIFRSLEGRDAG